jgi:hypothetical protein
VNENPLPRILRWRDWSGDGLEHAVLLEETDHIEVQSLTISGRASDGFAALYSLKLNRDWCVLEVRASIVGVPDFVWLRRTEKGQWFDRNDKLLNNLQDAFDVDLSITPLTNTLPVQRLRLAVGETAKITVAYIAFPQLTVALDLQRYTRLTTDRYRYESLDSDFVREITVDAHGFVITYPGLFRRVP